jgi:hypothetical protein
MNSCFLHLNLAMEYDEMTSHKRETKYVKKELRRIKYLDNEQYKTQNGMPC